MVQELALNAEALKGVKTSEIFSKGLWRLLSTGDDYRSACRLIAINPTLRAELVEKSAIIEARSRPLDPARMSALLVKHAMHFHVPDRTSEQWTDVLSTYLDALSPLSEEMLEEAFLRWNRSELYPRDPGRHAFFPKPAEIYKLAESIMIEVRRAAYRAKRAMEDSRMKPKPVITDEDRAKVKAQMNELLGSIGSRRVPGDRPGVFKPDEEAI